MKLSTRHLTSYLAKPVSMAGLVEAIEKSGIEVEGLLQNKPLNKKIVVGLTKKVVQHPNADKLRLVLVDIGTAETLHIVCGAPNVAEDQKVAVAMVGSVLPDGTEIHQAKLRGELSQGMLCSEAELGMSSDHAGILVLPEDYQIGKSLCDIVENDTIVDIKSAANRPDLQSYEGVAREIAAQLRIGLQLPKAELRVNSNPKLIKKSDKTVPAYSITELSIDEVRGLTSDEAQILLASDLRSISPVVDVTNYVLLTTGQPLHAFDADKIKLPLCARYAVKGEKLTTLDGKQRSLTVEDLIIADASGPVALAGVMGGANTEVTAATKRILLEAATFEATTVRKMAQRHGVRTEASARYERGLSVELLDRGRAQAVGMLETMGATNISGARLGAVESEKTIVEVKPEKINRLLGIEVPAKDMVKRLTSLGFAVSGLAKLKVQVPWWRPDIKTAADVGEEVIKMVGLEALPATIPAWEPHDIQFDNRRALVDRVRELLRASGLFEVTTYSFVSEVDLEQFDLRPSNHLKIKNPLSIEQAYMRSSLLPSLVRVLVNNQHYAKQFGISEVSKVFVPAGKKGDLPYEPEHIGVAQFGDYFAAKQILDLLGRELRLDLAYKASNHKRYYPGRQADVLLGGDRLGSIGELHPSLLSQVRGNRSVVFAELALGPLVEAASSHTYEPISRFPSIARDIAVVLDAKYTWSQVFEAVKLIQPSAKISFISRYEGAGIPVGKVSLALRLTLSSMERTLTDAEADAVVAETIITLKKKFKAQPRS